MKKFYATLVMALIVVGLSAQEKTTPRSEFTVELSTPTLEVKPGETGEVTITLNRSKSFAKSKVNLSVTSGLPQGVSIAFEPSEGLIDSSVARITLNGSVKPGTYTLILNSMMQNKSKGKMLKLVVNDAGEGISKN